MAPWRVCDMKVERPAVPQQNDEIPSVHGTQCKRGASACIEPPTAPNLSPAVSLCFHAPPPGKSRVARSAPRLCRAPPMAPMAPRATKGDEDARCGRTLWSFLVVCGRRAWRFRGFFPVSSTERRAQRANPHFYQRFGCDDVARTLLPTLGSDTPSRPQTGVEKSDRRSLPGMSQGQEPILWACQETAPFGRGPETRSANTEPRPKGAVARELPTSNP